MGKQKSIIEAISDKELFASVGRNRFFSSEGNKKGRFRLVLSISLSQEERDLFLSKLEEGFTQSEIFVEDHTSGQITYVLIYCRDAKVIERIAEEFLIHYPLRSNTRFDIIPRNHLIDRAKYFESPNI